MSYLILGFKGFEIFHKDKIKEKPNARYIK